MNQAVVERRGRGVVLRVLGAGSHRRGNGGTQDFREAEPQHEQAHQNRDDITQRKPGQGHAGIQHGRQAGDGFVFLEGGEGAGRDDGVDDRRREQVGHGAGERQSFLHEPPHHGHHGALAHRKHQAEKTRRQGSQNFVFRQHPLQQAGWQEGVDETGKQGADEDVRRAFKEDGEKGHQHIPGGAGRGEVGKGKAHAECGGRKGCKRQGSGRSSLNLAGCAGGAPPAWR